MSSGSYSRNRDTVVQSGNRRILKKPVMHPIFLEASDYTDDIFWKGKLVDASRGKFPPGFMFNAHGLLIFKKKTTGTQQARIEIPDDPLDAATIFINFLKTHDTMFSDTDIEYARNEEELNDHASSSKKGIQLSHVAEYSRYCSSLWGMTEYQERQFRQCLTRALNTGLLEQISTFSELEGIRDVKGIEYNTKRGIFFVDPNLIESPRYEYNAYSGTSIRQPKVTVKKIKVPTRAPYNTDSRDFGTLEEIFGVVEKI